MNRVPLLAAGQWLIVHWKLWGIPTSIAGAGKILQMWFRLWKATQDLKNSQLDGRKLQAEIDKLKREKIAAERELRIEKMVADVQDLVATLRDKGIVEITCGKDDNPEIFPEAMRRWKRRIEDRTLVRFPLDWLDDFRGCVPNLYSQASAAESLPTFLWSA